MIGAYWALSRTTDTAYLCRNGLSFVLTVTRVVRASPFETIGCYYYPLGSKTQNYHLQNALSSIHSSRYKKTPRWVLLEESLKNFSMLSLG